MKKKSKLIVSLCFSAVVSTLATMFLFAMDNVQSDTSLTSSAKLEMGWRQTKFGWQDSNYWFNESFTPPPLFEAIHPLIWAGLVLIAVISTMIWASEEWDWSRLWERNGS